MSETVPACPECGAGKVHLNSPGGHRVENDGGRYRCGKCYAAFDEYEERPRQRSGGTSTSGLAHRLDNASPDEVSR